MKQQPPRSGVDAAAPSFLGGVPPGLVSAPFRTRSCATRSPAVLERWAAKRAIVAFVTEPPPGAPAPASYPRRRASRPSTRTARCGSRSRCIPR